MLRSKRHPIRARAIYRDQPDLHKLARALWDTALYGQTRSRGHIASMELVHYQPLPSTEPHTCWSEGCNELAPKLPSL
jgi:hypothetical protein